MQKTLNHVYGELLNRFVLLAELTPEGELLSVNDRLLHFLQIKSTAREQPQPLSLWLLNPVELSHALAQVQNKGEWQGQWTFKIGEQLTNAAVTLGKLEEAADRIYMIAHPLSPSQQLLERFRAVLDETTDLIIVVDAATGRIIDANETAVQQLGFSRLVLLKRHLYQIDTSFPLYTTTAQWQAFVDGLRREPQQRRSVRTSLRLTPDETLDVDATLKLERYLDQEYIIVIARDISEQVALEKKLDSKEKFFETLIESTEDTLLLVDKEGFILYASPSCFKQWGYTVEELTGQSIQKLVHPDDSDFFEKVFKEIASTPKKLFKLTYRSLHKEGYYNWLEAQAKNLIREEAIGAILFSAHNVTNQVLAEERIIQALQQAERLNQELEQHKAELIASQEELRQTNEMLEKNNAELKKINQELDRFVYSASHDLRAPIASALGVITVCKMLDDIDQIKYYLDLQEKGLKKLDSFIQDILDYSRNARLEVQREEIDLQALIKGVFEQYAYMENAERIDKQVHIETPVPFFSDRRRLTIILNNLISNAIRYSSSRREHPYIKVSIKITENEGEFIIEDNGIGIEEKHLPRIFEMFYRATQDQAGSGLGLYIVKETIDKLRGQISLKSKYGEGTIFRFVVPNLLNQTPQAT